MKLEQQVVSLELSKQLEKAGYPQEGLWWWSNCFRSSAKLTNNNWYLSLEKKTTKLNLTENMFVAPTVAELGERLPIYSQGGLFQRIYAITEANARAKMWLYLKKEGLIKGRNEKRKTFKSR